MKYTRSLGKIVAHSGWIGIRQIKPQPILRLLRRSRLSLSGAPHCNRLEVWNGKSATWYAVASRRANIRVGLRSPNNCRWPRRARLCAAGGASVDVINARPGRVPEAIRSFSRFSFRSGRGPLSRRAVSRWLKPVRTHSMPWTVRSRV